MPLISHALVILATSLIASPHTAHAFPQQNGNTVTSPAASTASTPAAATTTTPQQHAPTEIPSVTETTPVAERDVTSDTTLPPTTLAPTTTPENHTTTTHTTIPPTTAPPTTTPTDTTTTTPATITTTIKPNTTTTTPTTTTTTPKNITTTPTVDPNTTATVITTTQQPDNTTDTPIPGSSTSSPPSPVPTDSSPSSAVTTVAPPGPHPGASIAISLFILVTVILVIGASVWWVRRRWQLERLRHQLMPVYNFDPTDDVDDWENQLLEEERSLRPEADKVQLYSGNATFEASQKPPSSATQKE